MQSVGRCEREDLSDARISNAVGTLAAAMSDARRNGVCAKRSFRHFIFHVFSPFPVVNRQFPANVLQEHDTKNSDLSPRVNTISFR